MSDDQPAKRYVLPCATLEPFKWSHETQLCEVILATDYLAIEQANAALLEEMKALNKQYIDAVTGRKEFREAYREAREIITALVGALEFERVANGLSAHLSKLLVSPAVAKWRTPTDPPPASSPNES